MNNVREKSTFDSHNFDTFLYNGYQQWRDIIYDTIQKHPILYLEPDEDFTRQELREYNVKGVRTIMEIMWGEYRYAELVGHPDTQLLTHLNSILNRVCLGAFVALTLHMLFAFTVENLGGERHAGYTLASEDLLSMKIFGCFSLTEISHGTNTQKMRTEAYYDRSTQEFVINTPDEEAAKCWVGNLGKHATHTILAAQLYIDGVCKGLHWFVVQIRDLITHHALPGVQVGDLGIKVGWNNIDHGWLMFNEVRIPRVAMLDKFQDVTPEGEYICKVDEKQRFGLTLAALSSGRVGIASGAIDTSFDGLTIALRYSAMRKQFGETLETPENPVLDYPLQQYRLLPYLGGMVAHRIFSDWLNVNYQEFSAHSKSGNVDVLEDNFKRLNSEFHGISSGIKPVSTWLCRDALQSCRECLGGHGYSYYAGLVRKRINADPNMTYEGENNVLIQQLARYLLSSYQKVSSGVKMTSPLHSIDYLNESNELLGRVSNIQDKNDFLEGGYLESMKWKVIFLLNESGMRMMELLSENSAFDAWNLSQVFYLQEAAKAHMEYIIVKKAVEKISQSTILGGNNRVILSKFVTLYAMFCLTKDLAPFYQGGYYKSEHATMAKSVVIDLLSELKDESVNVIDSVALPDTFQPALGKSNGEIYKNYWSEIRAAKHVTERAHYWEMLRTPIDLKPKL